MGWEISPTLRPALPPGKTRYPLYRKLGGSQGRSGQAENLVPTGIRSRTVQPGSSFAIPTEVPGPRVYIHIYIACYTGCSATVCVILSRKSHNVVYAVNFVKLFVTQRVVRGIAYSSTLP